MRRQFRLGVDLLISAICAGLVAGFLTAILITFVALGAAALVNPGTLLVGFFGAAYALIFATPAALLLGAVLWVSRLHHWLAWAAVGALTGLIFYFFLWGADSGPAAAETRWLVAIQLFAGACSSLIFRVVMRTLRAETDDY